MEPGRRADRLHLALRRHAAGSASSTPTAPARRLLTAGPRRRGAELGGEQPRARLPADRSRPAARHLPRQPRRQRAAQDDHSPGRIRPQLVGDDGLKPMRKPLLLHRPPRRRSPARRSCRASAGASAPPPAGAEPDRGAARRLRRAVGRHDGLFRAGKRAADARRRRTILAAQAMWLRQHPEVAVRIEGHGDPTDTAIMRWRWARERAAEVRDYLILLGVPAAQVTRDDAGARSGPGAAERDDDADPGLVRRRGADTRSWLARRAPGAALRRSRARSFRARSRRGIPGRGSQPDKRREVEPFVRFDEVDARCRRGPVE